MITQHTTVLLGRREACRASRATELIWCATFLIAFNIPATHAGSHRLVYISQRGTLKTFRSWQQGVRQEDRIRISRGERSAGGGGRVTMAGTRMFTLRQASVAHEMIPEVSGQRTYSSRSDSDAKGEHEVRTVHGDHLARG